MGFDFAVIERVGDILTFDVSVEELRSLSTIARMETLFENLLANTQNGSGDLKSGSLRLYKDQAGFLHIEFTSKSKFPYPVRDWDDP